MAPSASPPLPARIPESSTDNCSSPRNSRSPVTRQWPYPVAFEAARTRLAELINLKGEDKEVGLVDYGRDEPIPANTLIPFFRKRKAFAYEQEARFVANIYRCTDVRDETGKHVTPLPCLQPPIRDLGAFVEAIRVHPEADGHYFDVIKSVVKKYAPELLRRVEPSEMAAPPVF